MHWDDWEELIRREREQRRQEEKPLHDRIHQLEADLYFARQEIRHLQREKKELWERSQALALGTVFPGRELEEVKRTLEEAWLELVLVASPKAEDLSRIIALAYCTLGEMMDVLREVYGTYQEPAYV